MMQNRMDGEQENRDRCEIPHAEPSRPPAMTAEQARDLLAADQKNRVEQCGEALRDVLQAHGCQLQTKLTIIGDRVTSEILVLPLS